MMFWFEVDKTQWVNNHWYSEISTLEVLYFFRILYFPAGGKGNELKGTIWLAIRILEVGQVETTEDSKD